MKPSLVTLLLMAGLIVPAFALDSLDRWASTIWAQPLSIPKDSTSVVLTREGTGMFRKASAKTAYTSNPDGTYTQDYCGPDETSNSVFLENGTLLSSTADNVKDERIYNVKFNPERRQAYFRTEVKGKESSTKTQQIKPDNIIMSEYVNLIRQAWRNGVRGGFVFKGLAPDGSMEIDMETCLIETNVPWKVSDQYEIPTDFKAAFPDSQTYVVADFSLGGMFSLMYNFHTYWIFRSTPSGLDYVGSFGGNPKNATYTFMTE